MLSRSADYLLPGRLEDVLALIQVLGLHQHPYRSEDGLIRELQGNPISASSWSEVASRHREFFRVAEAEEREHPVSLVARHVSSDGPSDRRETAVPSEQRAVTPEFIQKLMETAVTIHDCQMKRSQRWTLYLPLWGAFVTGLLGIIAAALHYAAYGING